MSDTDNPAVPPEQPAAQQEAPAQSPPEPTPAAPAQPAPPAPQPQRPRPGREKPLRNPRNAGQVPSLEHEQSYGFGKKIAFDDDVERELQEAMSGLSDKELYGDPAEQARRGKAAPEQGPKKGKVFRIHGQDIF